MVKLLRSAEKRLEAILAAASDGIFLCDADGVILLANERGGHMFGYPASELLGQSVEVLIPQRLRAAHIQERHAYVHDPQPRPMGAGLDLLALCKDGTELPVVISLAPLITEEGILVVNIVRDVTERRRLQAELKHRNDDLMAADQRKDEFLAVLSHELRNPLAPIRAAVDVLRQSTSKDPDVTWASDVIARQVDQMARLIDDLLDVSRITGGKIRLNRERVSLAAVVASAIETARPLIEARRQVLHVELVDEVWLDGDAVRLSQTLANLLNNAAKYSDEGGPIWVTANIISNGIEIRVRDRGVGILADFLPRIFDTFAQADRSLDRAHGGLGIGLTLVKNLVELHGGTVHASSGGAGQGCEFLVRLPLPVDAAAASAAPVASAPVKPATYRILLADDNVDFAQSVSRLLRRRGHDVRVAHDGQVARELADELRPQVAILDIGLPGMNGYDLARSLRAAAHLAPMLIVAVSGYGRDEDRARAAEAGFDEHLTKPIQIDTLTAVLQAHASRTVPTA